MLEPLQFTRAQAAHHPCPKCGAEGNYIPHGKYHCGSKTCSVYYPAAYRYPLVTGSDQAIRITEDDI